MRNPLILIGSTLILSACATAPAPQAPTVVVKAEPINTCSPVSALQRVVIPAETKTFIAITEIANPPYEPIQRREAQVREISPEKVIYVDSNGREVLDICPEPTPAPVG